MSLIRSSRLLQSNIRALLIAPLATQKRTFASGSSNRPISPHVQIYAFPPTAISSITNRVAGCMLTGTVCLTGLIGFSTSGDALGVATNFAENSFFLLPMVKFGIAFPFTYHFASGIRHLLWDRLYGFDVKQAHNVSLIIIGSSIVIALYFTV